MVCIRLMVHQMHLPFTIVYNKLRGRSCSYAAIPSERTSWMVNVSRNGAAMLWHESRATCFR